ncbi:MAG: hypothetical protein QOI83_3308, partial [Streptomycetaceae bacterium]|nr:hypothetical protein [Streptomycetaceae bacterium]
MPGTEALGSGGTTVTDGPDGSEGIGETETRCPEGSFGTVTPGGAEEAGAARRSLAAPIGLAGVTLPDAGAGWLPTWPALWYPPWSALRLGGAGTAVRYVA